MTKNLYFKSAIIFVGFFSLFLLARLLNSGLTSSDDPYYHAKHAYLIEQSGDLTLVKPWLEFNFLNYAPADPWWGFHLGMALFIHWFGLDWGVKIFISFLAALIFLIFYLVLNGLKVKAPLVWTIFLFCSSTIFSYRLFLERPHLLSMIALPLALLLLIKGRNFWLFILSLVYALCYHLFPPLIFLALLYSAVAAYFYRQLNLKPLIASLGGVLTGIFFHPASLNYLYAIFSLAWQIIFLKFSGINLNIGGEVQFINFSDFLCSNFLALLFYILAVALFLSLKKFNGPSAFNKSPGKSSVLSNLLFLYSSFWLLVALLVPRGAEYWLPAVFLFTAVEFNDFIQTEEFKKIKKFLISKVNLKIAGFFLVSTLVLIVFHNLSDIFFDLKQSKTGELGQSYREVNDWLKVNTAKNSVVFYDNWGMWPMMFFYNDYNRYIIGIDPTLTYEYDQRTYWLWRHISSDGLYCDQPQLCLDISPRQQLKLVPLAIKTIFRAKYAVLVNYEQSNLIKTLNNLKAEAKLVLKSKDLLVYEMK